MTSLHPWRCRAAERAASARRCMLALPAVAVALHASQGWALAAGRASRQEPACTKQLEKAHGPRELDVVSSAPVGAHFEHPEKMHAPTEGIATHQPLRGLHWPRRRSLYSNGRPYWRPGTALLRRRRGRRGIGGRPLEQRLHCCREGARLLLLLLRILHTMLSCHAQLTPPLVST